MSFENWTIEDLFARCMDCDDMTLEMDKEEFSALRRKIAMLQAGNSPVIGVDLSSGPDRTVEVRYVAPPGYVMVPKDVSPEQLRAFQLKTKIGAYVTANWSDAYDSLRELWDVAISSAPQQEVK
ncbi:hypothetical protein [Klebsiella oxytoca]|uniref:hypothetical protein n=1 Tax=Klebsiella oxytoca TaxID=571 RepID=UPI003A92AD79